MTINLNKKSKRPNWAPLLTLSLVALLFALTATVVLADDHILYVDADATGGAGTGASWANAFTDLQAALDVAEAGDEIWVASAVYKPTKLVDPTNSQTATFELIEGVKIYGGFAGTEASLDERDWTTNVTVLSGDLDNNDVGADTNGGITPRAENTLGLNSYNVVIGNNAITYTNATVLDGFTVTGGQTTGLGGEAGTSDGAAIRFGDYASPILRNLHVIGNRSTDDGGGIYFRHFNNPIFDNVRVEHTFAKDFGGAIFMFDDNNPTFKNVTIVNTTGEYSAGIYIHDRNTINIVNFYGCGNVNIFGDPNGHGNSGTTLSFGSENTVQITNAAFTANYANENGAALRFTRDNDITLTNITMTGNQSAATDVSVPNPGGAIFSREVGNVLTVANSIIWGNSQTFGWGEGAQPTVNATYSIIGTGAAPEGVGNITTPTSPFKTDPTSGGDETWGTSDDTCGDLQPIGTSAIVNAGSSAALPADILDVDYNGDTAEILPIDLNKISRVSGSSVDIGAYELYIPPTAQTVTFTSPEANTEVPVDGNVTVAATASSGLPVTFSSLTPSICTVTGAQVSLIAIGDCIVQAAQAGNSEFGPATAQLTIIAGKRLQQITFPTPAGIADAEAGDTLTLAATADSGLAVTYTSSTPSVCTVDGSNLEIVSAGICRIEANQSGDAEWKAAPEKAVTLFIGQPTFTTYLPVVTK